MAGGHLHRWIFLFTCCSVLLPRVWFHDIEVSCRSVHKKVGDAVQLSPCSSTQGVVTATWKYEEHMIADTDENVSEKQFKNRLHLNHTSFTLTVRNLTLQDSGHFSFISSGENQLQRPTDVITLQVHEPIKRKPILTSNFTWHAKNNSCSVFLDCVARTMDRNVSYLWTLGNQTRRGSRLQFVLQPLDGATEVSCTVENFISQMSESTIVKCSNGTQESSRNLVLLLSSAGVCLVIFTGIVICVCHCKRRRPVPDSNEYAAIYEVPVTDETTMKKRNEGNESTENKTNSVTPGVQTVYDKIQLSRIPD